MSTSTSPSPSTTLPAFLRQSKSEIRAKFVDLEWQQRERLLHGAQSNTTTTSTPSPWARLTGEHITTRNRYMNVEPYASNRVRLRVSDGVNDYINASPIVLGKRRYIATQGPKDTSTAHFYRMLASEVEEGRAAVVVMLTQTHEAGREKCFQYYPLQDGESPMVLGAEEDGWGGEVVLEGVEEDDGSRSQLRKMRLRIRQGDTEAGAEKEEVDGDGAAEEEVHGEQQGLTIHHLLFSGWPDFLIPEGDDRAALVNLITLSASLNSPDSSTTPPSLPEVLLTDQSNPRIIHCSAGVGRSGTFIALDYLLSLLHSGELDNLEEDRDPIAETVDSLRRQRMMMVQGESQFNFLYEAVREAFEARAGEGRVSEVKGR